MNPLPLAGQISQEWKQLEHTLIHTSGTLAPAHDQYHRTRRVKAQGCTASLCMAWHKLGPHRCAGHSHGASAEMTCCGGKSHKCSGDDPGKQAIGSAGY